MDSADREKRLVVRFALGLASLVLAGAVLVAPVLSVPRILLAPEVPVRPGYRAMPRTQIATRSPTVVAVPSGSLY